MRTRRFDWAGPDETTAEIRNWFEVSAPVVDLAPIEQAITEEGDDALLDLGTERLQQNQNDERRDQRVEQIALIAVCPAIDAGRR